MAPSKRQAVLIGVNQCGYDVQLPALRFAESDAQDLRAVLLDQDYGTFHDGDVKMFIGPKATWREIKAYLREIVVGSGPSDVLLVYFAGHALVPEWNDQLDAYLVTADLDPEVLPREPDNGLRMSFLKQDVFEAFAGTSFLVLDCCQAGIYADADRRHFAAMHTYRTQVDRHSALLACPRGGVARESPEYGHGVLTHHVLRALRGDAADEGRRVSFARMAAFVAEQGIDPPPAQWVKTYGPATPLTQPPVSRHDRQALNTPANPGIIRPCKNPLEDHGNSIMQLLGRMFRGLNRPRYHAQQGGPAERVELIRYAVDADSVAVVEFIGDDFRVMDKTARFDRDLFRPMLELAADEAVQYRTSMPGHVVSDGGRRRMLCVPVKYVDERVVALAVVNPAPAQLEMGEPLAVILRAVWDSDPVDDPVESEMTVMTALRIAFGRLPAPVYEYAFTIYQKLIDSMTMVFQPVVELSRHPAGVGVHSFEALARRNEREISAPLAALRMAYDWGDRFIIERDALLVSKAIRSYAEAAGAAGWQGIKPLSVNVAVRSLLRDAYLQQVSKALAEADVNPGTLTLEISEQDPIEPGPGEDWPQKPLDYFHRRLTALAKKLHINFAVDDFGVGHASLARMAELRLTQIKVDRAVLHHPLAVDELRLVAQVARYARDQGDAPHPRAVVVEGYDDEAPVSLRQIWDLGIHHVQGYFCGAVASASLHPLDGDMQEQIASRVKGER
ncbi:EAL domain-containing protein [Micromonospora sediminimaris]|uniref:EAL domain-containing protein n=1 Tax=Micromonospora sediminimaris TaxID=547162 RepID=UPI003787A544